MDIIEEVEEGMRSDLEKTVNNMEKYFINIIKGEE